MASPRAAAKTARTKLLLDGDVLDEYRHLEEELQVADPDSAYARALAEQVTALDEHLVEFVFRGAGRGTWRALKADYPAPDSDEERLSIEQYLLASNLAIGALELVGVDIDTFPFAAMAASLVSPTSIEIAGEDVLLDMEGFQRLDREVLDEMQFSQLWSTCVEANTGRVNRPGTLAARALLSMVSERPKSAPPSDSESVEAS